MKRRESREEKRAEGKTREAKRRRDQAEEEEKAKRREKKGREDERSEEEETFPYPASMMARRSRSTARQEGRVRM